MTAITYPTDYGTVTPGGHCGVLAVALLAGRSFQEAWGALSPPGLRRGRWKGATNHPARMAVLRRWAVPVRTAMHMTAADLRFMGGKSPLASFDRALPRCSVATFARDHAKPGVTYMLRVSRHVVTLRDGIVIDQQHAAPAASHRSGRCIVTHSVERLPA